MSDSDLIGRLYEISCILSDTEEEKQWPLCYKEVLEALKGSSNQKRVAGQILTQHFRKFPSLYTTSLEAAFDLCEDGDVNIRKQMIRQLPLFCGFDNKMTTRVADALTQLLQTVNFNEFRVVQDALMAVFKIDPSSAILGIFHQINTEDRVRDRALKFLQEKFEELHKVIVSKGAESLFCTKLRKAYRDAVGDEMTLIFNLMSATNEFKTPVGQDTFAEFLKDQLENDPINMADELSVQSWAKTMSFANSLQKTGDRRKAADKFVPVYCKQLIPKLQSAPKFDEGAEDILQLMRLSAEAVSKISETFQDSAACLKHCHQLLKSILPLPTADDEEPIYQFSYIECLMFMCYKLSSLAPAYWADIELLKDFRSRIQYLARSVQGYIKTLNEALKRLTPAELKLPENEKKSMALKVTSNINIMIKDFHRSPPRFKEVVNPSWNKTQEPPVTTVVTAVPKPKPKPVPVKQVTVKPPPPQKRPRPFSLSRELYTPPSGKYSKVLTDRIPRGPRNNPLNYM